MNGISIVIPTVQTRKENLAKVVEGIRQIDKDYYRKTRRRNPIKNVVIVRDGWKSNAGTYECTGGLSFFTMNLKKHEPGDTQPRNIGVYHLVNTLYIRRTQYVWFLDSDVIPTTEALKAYVNAIEEHPEVDVFFGLYNPNNASHDERSAMFETQLPPEQYNLNYALACWAGNLMWKIKSFTEVGGFHADLHMGRCEDGELGLRASSLGKIMMPVKGADLYHIPHASNYNDKIEKNKRDVPLIQKWHPWVQEQGLIVSSKDGARFDRVCSTCGEEINSIEWYEHEKEHLSENLIKQA